MKKLIAVTAIATLALAAFAGDAAIEKAMKAIKKPNKTLKTLAATGQFKDPAFATAAATLKKEAEAFAKYQHKEAKFNEFNKKFLEAATALDAAVKAGDFDKTKAAWADVSTSCDTCHDAYKD